MFGKLGTVVLILLFLASCAPAAPTAVPTKPAAPPAAATTAPTTAPPKAAPTPTPAPPTATPAPKVKRGGTLIRLDDRDATSWDPAFSTNSTPPAECPALEALLSWTLVDANAGKHEIYKRCHRLLYEDAGIVGTRLAPWNAVYRKEVQNLRTNEHVVDLREIWLDK